MVCFCHALYILLCPTDYGFVLVLLISLTDLPFAHAILDTMQSLHQSGRHFSLTYILLTDRLRLSSSH